MYLKIKYILVFIFMVFAPSLIKLTPFPYELIWCLIYGVIVGNIIVYAYRYQNRKSNYEELIRLNNELMEIESELSKV